MNQFKRTLACLLCLAMFLAMVSPVAAETATEGNVQFSDVALAGITVTAPTKTVYEQGQSLDTTGMVVTAVYADETTAVIEAGYEVTGYVAETLGQQTVTVTYEGFTATFTVTVEEPMPYVASLVLTGPTKTEYNLGEALDLTGLTVTAVWSDEYEEEVAEGYEVTGYDANTPGEQTVTVSYEGASATFTVTVKATDPELVYCIYGHHDHTDVECSEPLLVWQEWTNLTKLPTANGNYFVAEGSTITTTNQMAVTNTATLYDINLDLRGSKIVHPNSTVRAMIIKGAEGSQYTITSTVGQATLQTTAETVTTNNATIDKAQSDALIFANIGTFRLVNMKVDASSIKQTNQKWSVAYLTNAGCLHLENCEIIGGASKNNIAIYQTPYATAYYRQLVIKDTTVEGGVVIGGSAARTYLEGTVKLLPNEYCSYGIKGTVAAAEIDCKSISTDSVLYIAGANFSRNTVAEKNAAKGTMFRAAEGFALADNATYKTFLTVVAAETWCINGHTTHAACVAAGCTEDQLAWTALDPATTTKLPTAYGNYYFSEPAEGAERVVNLTAQSNTSAASGHIYYDLSGFTVNQTTENERVLLVHGGSQVTFSDSVGGGKLVYAPTTTNADGAVLYVNTGTLNIIGDITVDASTLTTNRMTGGAIFVLTNGNLFVDGATILGGASGNGDAISFQGTSMTLKNATLNAAANSTKNTLHMTKPATLENVTVNGKTYSSGARLTVNGGKLDSLLNSGGQDTLDLQGNVQIGAMELVNEEGWGKTDNLGDAYDITLVNGSWGNFASVADAQAAIDAGLFKAAANVKLVAVANGKTAGRIEARPLRCVYGHTDHTDIECDEPIVDWRVLKSDITNLPTANGNYYFKDNATIALLDQAEAVNTETKYDIKVDLRGATVTADNRAVVLKGLEGSQYIITDTLGGAKISSTDVTNDNKNGGVLFANIGTVRLIDVDIDSTSITTNTYSGSAAHVLTDGIFIAENAIIKGGVATDAAIYYTSGKGMTLKNVTVEGGVYATGSCANVNVSGVVKLLKGVNTYGLKGGNTLAGLICYDLAEGSVIEAYNLNYNFRDNEAAQAAVDNGVIVSAQEGVTLLVEERQVAAGVGGAVTAIEIYAAPKKLEYVLGEELNTKGLNVRVTWESGVTREVKDYEVTGYEATKVGEQTITVTYEGLTATFTVTVKEPALTGITVTAPTKVEYWTGEELDLTGMVVTATYENETTAIISEGYEVTGYEATKAGEQTITVTYGEFTATFTVTVAEAVATGITVTAPTKVEYWTGEELDLTGMVVTATYENETTAIISEGYEVTGYEATKAGEQTITVTYGEFTATFTVTVAEALPEEPEVELIASGNCGPKDANGEWTDSVTWTLDVNGVLTISGEGAMADFTKTTQPWKAYRNQIKTIVVKEGVTTIGKNAFYYSKYVTSITIPETVSKIAAYATLTCSKLAEVNYASSRAMLDRILVVLGNDRLLGAETINTVEPVDTELKLNAEPAKLIYEQGEKLDLTGMELVVVDAEGNESVVTDGYVVHGYNNTSLTTQEITLVYKGLYTCFSVNVRATGTCGAEGSNASFCVTDGKLTISGTGAIADNSRNQDPYKAYRKIIKTVVIEEGITTVGKYSLNYLSRAGTVYLPLSLTSIRNAGFFESNKINNIFYAGTAYQWSKVSVGASNELSIGDAEIKTATPKAVSISITEPTKKEYVAGETLDLTGLTITITYNDGNTRVVDGSETDSYKLSTFYPNKPVVQTLTVTYANRLTATFQVSVVASGTCGDNLSWTIKEGVLTVSGEGAMTAVSLVSKQPWKSYTASIQEAVFEEGVTEIANYSFANCHNLKSISLPSTLTKLGKDLLYSATATPDVTYAGTAEQWAAVTVGANNTVITDSVNAKLNAAE